MKKVAIFGAGQLGSYLCLAAKDLNIETLIISPDDSSPATKLADHTIIGELTESLVTQVAQQVDVVTFEREDIPADIIKAIEASNACEINPTPAVMSLIADKGTQKQWLQDNKFPTATFQLLDGSENTSEFTEAFGDRFVQKARTGGFDGRGVQVVDKDTTLWPVPSIIEPFVTHEMEIAVLVAKSTDGTLAVYPVVELLFETSGNILKYALSPARIPDHIAVEAQGLARNIAVALGSAGLLAVEMFLTTEGELLVNEISPRVHNSGHLTIEANNTSQFAQHLRAICGFDLGSTEQSAPAAVMANILFEDKNAAACESGTGIISQDASTQIHWYGKTGAKPLRKMGHVTAVAGTLNDAKTSVDEALNNMEIQQ